jgi:hypothetical protein
LSHTADPAIVRRIAAMPRLPLAHLFTAENDLVRMVQHRDFPVVVTAYGGVAMMRGSRIGGMRDDYLLGMPTWKDIWVR